jgi:hypothetical protein
VRDGASAGRRIFSPEWIWLFPPVYLVHLLDERLFGIGTAEFATRYLGMHFTDFAWLLVNVPSFLLVTLTAWLVARRSWPQWLAVTLATHLALHALGRVPTSIWFSTIAPGLLSGLLLCLPLAVATWIWAERGLSRTQLLRGLLLGLASFQPLWHFLLLPVLPAPPRAP